MVKPGIIDLKWRLYNWNLAVSFAILNQERRIKMKYKLLVLIIFCSVSLTFCKSADEKKRDTVVDTKTEFDDQFISEEGKRPIYNNVRVMDSRAAGIVGIEKKGDVIIVFIKAVSKNPTVGKLGFDDLSVIHIEQDGKKYKCREVSDKSIWLIKGATAKWSFTFEGGWDPRLPFDLIEGGNCKEGCLEYTQVLFK